MKDTCANTVTESVICDPIKLNSWVQGKLSSVKTNLQSIPADGTSLPGGATMEDCHWVPQWVYTEASNPAGPLCNHRLLYENLDNEFDEMVAKFAPKVVGSITDPQWDLDVASCQ